MCGPDGVVATADGQDGMLMEGWVRVGSGERTRQVKNARCGLPMPATKVKRRVMTS